jgi:hypothetical protein
VSNPNERDSQVKDALSAAFGDYPVPEAAAYMRATGGNDQPHGRVHGAARWIGSLRRYLFGFDACRPALQTVVEYALQQSLILRKIDVEDFSTPHIAALTGPVAAPGRLRFRL